MTRVLIIDDDTELCELLAAQSADPRLSCEWRLMAQEWRMASTGGQDSAPLEARTAV